MVRVQLFGNFEIENEHGKISQGKFNSRRTKIILAYLLINRQKICTKDEMIDILWQEEKSSNSSSALKTAMHRARATLDKVLGKREYIISYKGNGYGWNPEIETEIDTEQFEKCIREAEDAKKSVEERIPFYEKAIGLYKGDFLAGERDMHWMVALESYYRGKMLKCINELAEIYLDTEQFKKMDEICMIGLKNNFIDELLYYYKILSQIMQDNYEEAKKIYEDASRLLKAEFGTDKLDKLETLGSAVMEYEKPRHGDNVEKIYKSLKMDSRSGAFLCSYPVFCEIYRLESRKRDGLKIRGGESAFDSSIMLININKSDEGRRITKEDRELQKACMKSIEKIIMQNIRGDDVIAQYSDYQYVIMLADSRKSVCRKISERILKAIERSGIDADIKIEYKNSAD